MLCSLSLSLPMSFPLQSWSRLQALIIHWLEFVKASGHDWVILLLLRVMLLLLALPYSARFISISRVKIEPLIFKTFPPLLWNNCLSHLPGFLKELSSSLSLKSLDTEISLLSSGMIMDFNWTLSHSYKTLEFEQSYRGPYESQIQTWQSYRDP